MPEKGTEYCFEIVVENKKEEDKTNLKAEIDEIIAPELGIKDVSKRIGGWGAAWEIIALKIILLGPIVNAWLSLGERFLKLMKSLRKKEEIAYFSPDVMGSICAYDLIQKGMQPKKILANVDLTLVPIKEKEEGLDIPRTGVSPRTYLIVIKCEDGRVFQYIMGDNGEQFLFEELPTKNTQNLAALPTFNFIDASFPES